MDQNGLIEVLGDLADDLFSKLFCEENDHEQALALIEKFYQNKTKTLPSLDDVMMCIDDHNNDILYELADLEMYMNCHSCLDQKECWPNGIPEMEKMWHEDYYNADDIRRNQDNCLTEYIDLTYNHILNNYASWCSLEDFALELISMLGYSVVLDESDLHLVYDNAPIFYSGDMKIYFNDAQRVLIPDFTESVQTIPRLLITRHPLLITA